MKNIAIYIAKILFVVILPLVVIPSAIYFLVDHYDTITASQYSFLLLISALTVLNAALYGNVFGGPKYKPSINVKLVPATGVLIAYDDKTLTLFIPFLMMEISFK